MTSGSPTPTLLLWTTGWGPPLAVLADNGNTHFAIISIAAGQVKSPHLNQQLTLSYVHASSSQHIMFLQLTLHEPGIHIMVVNARLWQ